jgi:hypothetical protein
MVKKAFTWPLLCIMVAAFSSVFAQTPIVKYLPWVNSISSVWQPSQGGYMAVGNDANSQFFMLIGMDGMGDTLWTKQYSLFYPMTNRWSVCAAAASDGGCFILCGAREWLGGGDYCSFNSVMRTNAHGDSTWNVIISSEVAWSGANLNNLVATPDGGCVVVGESSDHGSFCIVKIDASGKMSWESVIAGDCYPTFQSVCVSSDGGYIATGYNNGCSDGVVNLMVAKFNTVNGDTLWSKIFHSGAFNVGDGKKAQGYSVVATSDGGCLLSGYVSDSGTYAGSALLMRLNASGNSLWTKTFFHSSNQQPIAYRLAPVASGQYMMFLDQNANYTSAQATLVKLNASGDSLWSQIGYDYKLMMTGIDQEGGVLLVGYYPATFIRTTAGGLYVSPQLASPGDGSTNVTLRPNLAWSGGYPFQLVSSFHVQVASDSLFTNVVFDTSNVTGEAVQINQLPVKTGFFWRVQSYGKEGGPTQWSDVWKFTTAVTSVERTGSDVPTLFSLQQNYPNPFNPSTIIQYGLPTRSIVRLIVYNVLGQVVKELINNEQQAGYQSVIWNATVSSGLYFCRLEATSKDDQSKRFVETKKMLLLR